MEFKGIDKALFEKGLIDEDGRFVTEIPFKRNPTLDHVWIPGVGKNGTSISADELIASTMQEILGGRAMYIAWVRKAAQYIASKSGNAGKTGIAGLSRLIQREAIAFIRDHNKAVSNE